MLFRVCEHYNDDYEYMFQEKYNDCFICFEYKNNFENKPTTLRKQQLYFSNCNCNLAVHNNCLQIWLDKNKSCPICRNSIIVENNNIIIILRFVPFGIRIYTFIQMYTMRFIRNITAILFLYALIDFYFNIINTKYVPYDNYTYVPIPILQDTYLNESNKFT